jgi:two-component system response regulator AtoC
LGLTLKDIERKIIEATLELNEGRRNDTARMLGISDRGLRNKINEYKLK